MILDLSTTASAAEQNVAASIDKKPISAPPRAGSPLIADCTETVFMPPLSPRPALKRATFASKPALRHRHRHHVRPHKKAKPKAAHRIRHVKHLKHKPAHHKHKPARQRHRPVPRRHAPERTILHRVTYASPLCGERSTVLNDMIGLPGVTQPPVPADSSPAYVLPIFLNLPPVIGGPGPVIGPTGPGPIVVAPPIGPIFPVSPGPIIIQPPGPPVTPPVSPPVTPPVSHAPEPSSWAMMLIGMMLVGGSVRRRAARKAA